MPSLIEPPHSVLLLVGREEFTPPGSFGGATCVTTEDCLAIAVADAQDSPTSVTLDPAPDTRHLQRLGEFVLETEGLLSLRDVWSREYDAAGVGPGLARVTVWGDALDGPTEIALQFAEVG